MYCKNCGNKINDNDKFCTNCGTAQEMQKKYTNLDNPKYKKKKWLLIIFIISIITFLMYGVIILVDLTGTIFSHMGRYSGELHEYKDFINYVENIKCDINNKEKSCNLINKYEIVSDESSFDDNNKEIRTITFKIKNTNLIFSVKSAYHCTSSLDGSCFKYSYQLSDDFKYSAFEYYIEEYNKKVGYNNNYCYKITDDCVSGWFKIKSYADLKYVIDYMNGFLNYINNLDFKFIDKHKYFNISFEKTYENGANYSLGIYFDIVDNKYTYKFRDEYMPVDRNVETYIKNYMNVNEISLEGI